MFCRSKIQGLGLYAARDIEKNTMIIEYIGEIIRSELAEVRQGKLFIGLEILKEQFTWFIYI